MHAGESVNLIRVEKKWANDPVLGGHSKRQLNAIKLRRFL